MSLRWLHQAWAALALMYILFFVLAVISAQVPAVLALVYRSLSQLLGSCTRSDFSIVVHLAEV